VERGTGGLGRDIPQRDIHRRQGVSERSAASEDGQLGLDFAHQRTYVRGILAHT
jgi:hypothetical protein